MSVWSAHHFSLFLKMWYWWNLKFVFPFAVLPSALTTQQGSCPSREKPATVTGLLECRKRDETKLIKNLITGEMDPCTHYSSSSTSFPSSHWFLEIPERQDKVMGIYLNVFLRINYTVCLFFSWDDEISSRDHRFVALHPTVTWLTWTNFDCN